MVILEGAKVSKNHKQTACHFEHLNMCRDNFVNDMGILKTRGYFSDGMLRVRKPRNDKGSHRINIRESSYPQSSAFLNTEDHVTCDASHTLNDQGSQGPDGNSTPILTNLSHVFSQEICDGEYQGPLQRLKSAEKMFPLEMDSLKLVSPVDDMIFGGEESQLEDLEVRMPLSGVNYKFD